MSRLWSLWPLSLSTEQEKQPPYRDAEQQQMLVEDRNFDTWSSRTQKQHRKTPQHFVVSCPLLAALVALPVVLTIAVVALSISHPMAPLNPYSQPLAPKKIKPCGDTSAEARRNGCQFDVISFCWQHPQCFDAELSRDFHSTNDLQWFLDPNRTQPLTYEEIMTGDYTGLYVNWDYHLRHCTAMWKKMHRAILKDDGQAAIDSYIGVYEHTEHCEHMLLGGRDVELSTINTRIKVKFPDCGL